MKMKLLAGTFVVCQVPDFSQVDLGADFIFLAKTDEESSVVCRTEAMPLNQTKNEPGWRAFRIEGQLDFTLIGILAQISTLLAQHEISIYVVSTFNTDYFLVKAENLSRAIFVLGEAGYLFSADAI